jgi:hypothetical protein
LSTWKTKDGRVVRIVDLETNHLCNILRLFRRRAVSKYFRRELGEKSFERIVKKLRDPKFQVTRSWRNYVADKSKFMQLEREAKNRGIDWENWRNGDPERNLIEKKVAEQEKGKKRRYKRLFRKKDKRSSESDTEAVGPAKFTMTIDGLPPVKFNKVEGPKQDAIIVDDPAVKEEFDQNTRDKVAKEFERLVTTPRTGPNFLFIRQNAPNSFFDTYIAIDEEEKPGFQEDWGFELDIGDDDD